MNSLRQDVITFAVILSIVLAAIIGLYYYDQQTGVISTFSKQLFDWLIN